MMLQQIPQYYEPEVHDENDHTYKCSHCTRVPLNPLRCQNCHVISCVPCHQKTIICCKKPNLKILEDKLFKCLSMVHECRINPQYPSPPRENVPCRSSTFTDDFQTAGKFLDTKVDEENTVYKSPQKGLKQREMNVVDLHEHVNSDCPRSRYCFKCSQLFESIPALQKHYKLDCPFVQIQCSHCDHTFQRDAFRRSSHLCYRSNLHAHVKKESSPIGVLMFLIFCIVIAVVSFQFFILNLHKNEYIQNLIEQNNELMSNYDLILSEMKNTIEIQQTEIEQKQQDPPKEINLIEKQPENQENTMSIRELVEENKFIKSHYMDIQKELLEFQAKYESCMILITPP